MIEEIAAKAGVNFVIDPSPFVHMSKHLKEIEKGSRPISEDILEIIEDKSKKEIFVPLLLANEQNRVQ
ncbi:MAG: hypothetical protein ABIP54_00785 [Candidatus Andersenbacteria bacterium]